MKTLLVNIDSSFVIMFSYSLKMQAQQLTKLSSVLTHFQQTNQTKRTETKRKRNDFLSSTLTSTVS